MNIATALDFVNLFFAGMLAGIEFVIHYGLRGPSEILDEQSQLQLRQALVMRLRVLVPAFFCADSSLRDCPNGSGGWHTRLLVSVCGSGRHTHLDRDQGYRHRPYQQCHARLAAQRATQELEVASQSRGAVPYCWGLGGGPGICVLLDCRGTQADHSLIFRSRLICRACKESLEQGNMPFIARDKPSMPTCL